ncbi:TetR/AcrR family transcriptional regulator C-terminal domain-containing protein [Sphaerisporangium sp. NBC_01403]|uniref:TetR/AcrR family transcriptional regulator C-terminal domain-containing protein n=1 Tax=Sphaerisporangium sp. NBC_01403 TaxID=2903599 RepID=UPI00325417A1
MAVVAKSDPPYLRIAAEIRRRIADGELAPGERVPSTRRIAREWDVALATATKALTALRQEGLVEARPRAGTVVAPLEPAPERPRHRAAADPDHELTRERIVRAAIEIADAEGLAALSMRGVAARLGVATMSPYRHVNSKDDLILLMADAAFGEESYPAEVPSGWRARLELGGRKLWEIHRRHPWLAQITALTRPVALPSLMVHAEWALSALDGHGLGPATMLDLHVLFYSYVQGIAANLERAAQAEALTGLSEDQWMDLQAPALTAIAASGDCPTFARITGELVNGYELRLDELFELGLKQMLDGLAVRIEGPATGGRPAR